MATRLNPLSTREGLFLDTGEWEMAVRDLMKVAKTKLGKVVEDEAKLLVRDCIYLTPPTTGGAGIIKESLKKQQQAGEKAVTNDLKKVVKNVTQLQMYKNPKVKKWLDAAFKKHDWALVMDIINDKAGTAGMQVPSGFHEKHRNKRGRVKSGPRFYVKDTKNEAKLKAYANEVFKRIGKAKAGWLPAARRLKVAARDRIAFISRHRGKGRIAMKTKNTPDPFVYVANMVSHAQKHGREERIMAVALKYRTQSIRAKIEKVLKANTKKWAKSRVGGRLF